MTDIDGTTCWRRRLAAADRGAGLLPVRRSTINALIEVGEMHPVWSGGDCPVFPRRA